jgi:lipoate-protein ligase B
LRTGPDGALNCLYSMSSSLSAKVPDQSKAQLRVRQLGLSDYEPVWHAMQDFTDQRDEHTIDELWLVQHPAVFTQGQAGKA